MVSHRNFPKQGRKQEYDELVFTLQTYTEIADFETTMAEWEEEGKDTYVVAQGDVEYEINTTSYDLAVERAIDLFNITILKKGRVHG